ncbi:MAG: isoaspartyl peptidase/L-asparaginase [Burkholderiaceae bacterium]|nr:isoaspartyl peptidase/L-asparaginase [Burkholderiaceae bacterium]
MNQNPIAIGIHGGCGTLEEELRNPDHWAEVRAALHASLQAAWRVLDGGGTALDAVEAAVVVMEDSEHFNAGHGAALNSAGDHELDAAIMDGSELRAGAVCAARTIRNPIRAARAVMEHSDCVLICGAAADQFAERCGMTPVPNSYFTTAQRRAALASLKARELAGTSAQASEAERHGTVGAVALDRAGNLAAATSTGGFNNKVPGRIGDSPIIGAGTYAANGVCAVSCTGQGEIFIRHVAAHEIAARLRYAGQGLEEATNAMIFNELSGHGIGAGVIALDAAGAVVAPFNTNAMARGWIGADGVAWVATHAQVHRAGG